MGSDGQVLTADSGQALGVKWNTVSGTGDVVGPSSATDNALTRFDGTTGKLIQNSIGILSDTGNLTLGTFMTITGTGGTLELLADTDGGDFNIFHAESGTKTLAFYGSAGNIMDINLLDGVLKTGSTTRLLNNGTANNFTYDTAGTGNTFKINGTAISAVTGTGAVVLAGSPTITTAVLGSSTATTQTPADNSTKLATTAYVDNAVLGQNFKEAVGAATTANLVGTYSNGSSGVGATFTYTATGVDTIDGVALTLGMRVLVKNQVTTFQNGIYIVTTAGAIGVAGILTRALDSDQSSDWRTGDSVFATAGTAQSATTWAYTGVDNPTMGTDAITFAQTAGQGSFTAGSGITITGNSIALTTPVTVALGGTNATSASITAFNNITGYSASGATGTTSTNLVFSTSPSLTTPTLGVASATSINKVTITAPASSATLTIPDGVTLTGPASSGTAMTLGNTETVTGVKTFGSSGAVGRLKIAGTTSGDTVLDATAVASGTLTLPAATDTLVGKATTDTLTNKTLTTPTIASFTNATHNHTNAAGGGLLDLSTIDTTAWSSWTPTWVNFTIGNGTNAWKYRQIGKTVYFRGVTILGSTSSMSTGPTFTLPVTSVTVPHTNMQICTLKLYNGSGNFNGEGNWATTTTCLLQVWDTNNNTVGVTATAPGTWATGWGIFAQGFYEVA